MTTPDTSEILRPHAEVQYGAELAALDAADDRERPPSWRLSPWAVVTYLVGGTLADGTVIVPKYVGRRRLMEIAVATLATDRALLLLGVPGTAKTWVSEHLAAAISGDSTLARAGHRRNDRRDVAVRLELRPPARRGPDRSGAGAEPDLPGDAARFDRPCRRTDPHALRRARRLGHGAVREVDAGARAEQRGSGDPWFQRDRHRQRPRPRRERPVVGPQASLQHRRAAAARDGRGRDRDRGPTRQRARRRAGRCRRSLLRPTRSAGLSPSSASCATG